MSDRMREKMEKGWLALAAAMRGIPHGREEVRECPFARLNHLGVNERRFKTLTCLGIAR